ncbi:ferric reductase-like transmembrane domain-containing protein [Rhodobacteraceae bacterium NNCM2]|nr:ferric reductase-like transmembrane domain-containing protein [Coraliihabitans acroporae]
MKPYAQKLAIAAAIAVFMGLPLLFYGLGEFPRRSVLKEVLSLATILAFVLILGQFFLARTNVALLEAFKAPAVQKVHRYIGYGAIGVIFLHPLLIVLPRFLEGGVTPWNAFVTMITSFDTLGILLGIAAWLLMVALGLTAWFRMKLMKRFANRYRGWRYLHGGLALAFVGLGTWHALDLGRHMDWQMTVFCLAIAGVGVSLLARLYWAALPKRTAHPTHSEGART